MDEGMCGVCSVWCVCVVCVGMCVVWCVYSVVTCGVCSVLWCVCVVCV